MFKNTCCSICLCINEKTINIQDTDLQYVYEKLANFKVKPELCFLCYICHTRLRQFVSLQNTASSSQSQPLVHLTIRNIETETIPCSVVLAKEEPREFDAQERYFDSDSTIKQETENMESLDGKENVGSHVEEKNCDGLETATRPKRMRVQKPARVVQKSSDGSLLTGASVACEKTPAGHVPVLEPSKPLCVGSRRISRQQLDMLWEHLNSHRDIAVAYNRSLEAKEYSKRKWQELAEILNAEGAGAHKDWKSWSKYWIDYKAKLKRRVAALRLSQHRTGGGPSTEQPLSDIENKFLQILGGDYGQGLSGVRVEPLPPVESTPAMAVESMDPFPECLIQDQQDYPASESILAPSSSLQTPIVQAPGTPPPSRTPPIASPAPVEPTTVLSPRRRRHRREVPLTMRAIRRSLIQSSERRAQATISSSQHLERIGDTLIEIKGALLGICSSLQQIESAVERVEAMDLSEKDEVMEACPDLPQDAEAEPKRGGEAEGCSSTDVPKPSTSAEVAPDNASGIISICAANISNSEGSPNATSDDVLPSTSGTTKTRKRSARSGVREGSELDSDFDDEFDDEFEDEFDESAVDVTNLATLDRNIPNDDDLEEPVRQIIGAMENVMDAEADRLPGVSTSYDWKEDFDTFTGVPERFSGPTPGPVKDYDTAYDAFTDIWSKDIIDRIVLATNRYAKQTIDWMKAEGTLKPSSRLHKWTDTDADEIMVLFAVFMYMAIDPRTNQYEYWKADDYLEMPKFRKLMTYNRYILLSNFLYFVDNSDVSQNSPPNEEIWLSPKLAKLQPVISHLKYKFASLYNLERFISIDESLTLFKGRLAWVQTIRTKAARFGIKSYELCESRTGYMYDFEIYTGKDSDRNDTADADVAPSVDLAGKSTKIVLHLLKDLKNRGHCVTMDNFYNCPALARYLKSLGFDCLGTLRPNRRNVPSDVAKMPNNVAKGTIVARHCGDVSVLGWKDSKVVTMISTYHTDDTFVGSKKGKMQVKPKSVGDYNKTMGGVDLKDQKLSMYLLERKRGVKWYTKIFKRLLNTSIHNALIMLVTSLARRNKLPMTQREFRYDLAKSLVDRHHRGLTVTTPKASEVTRLRRDIVHEPMYSSGRNNRKRCNVCYRQGIDKMVHSQCVTCAQYLCFEKCWKEWHSLTNLKSKVSGRKRSRIGN